MKTNNILSIYYNIFPYYIYIYTLIVINISLLCLWDIKCISSSPYLLSIINDIQYIKLKRQYDIICVI